MRPRARTLLLICLFVLSLPGLMLLVRDIFRPSKSTIVERAAAWHPVVRQAAERFDLDPALILAVIAVESKGDPGARGTSGECGLMQIMPATGKEQAEFLGIPDADLFDPETNITLGAAYLKEQLLFFGDKPALALAAYNAGPRRVRAWLEANPGLTGTEVIEKDAFPGTRSYVRHVLGYRELIAQRFSRDKPQ